jgi:hypothetical protein
MNNELQDACFAKPDLPGGDWIDPADRPTTWEAAWIDLGGEG